MYAHILAPFPEEVILEGKGYVLHGGKFSLISLTASINEGLERVKWTYGTELRGRLFWDAALEGDELGEVEMATDKWKFWFQDVCKTHV